MSVCLSDELNWKMKLDSFEISRACLRNYNLGSQESKTASGGEEWCR